METPSEGPSNKGHDKDTETDTLADVLSFAELARGAMKRRLGELTHPANDPSVDDQLARLVYDSCDDPVELASVRSSEAGGSATRQLTFESPGLLIEVQVDGRSRELTCQVVPAQPSTLEIRHGEGSINLGRDDSGTFYAMKLPAGPLSLRCVPLSGSPPAETSWLTI